MDYYNYEAKGTVELFLFEPGEDDITPQENSDIFDAIKPKFAANPGDVSQKFPNQIKSHELNQDDDKKAPDYDVFHKSPDEIVLIKTEEAEDAKLDAKLSDSLTGARSEDQVKESCLMFFDLIEAAKLFDPGLYCCEYEIRTC